MRIGFPREVNEKAARTVASGVVVLAVITLVTRWSWLPVLMAAGFALRALSGPRYSPLGRLAAQVVAPRLGAAVLVPGAPKRFAQTIGFVFTAAASIAWLGLGSACVALSLIGVLLVFASLEAVLGFCAGCYVFSWLMHWGLVPAETCQACHNITLRTQQSI
ncbi:DUF4395 domain-containing protein [Yimella sp. cx-51]|uniref:DUF4395 domain-containing protein n=1 Tax=Yimella sp. cx-51 TaxID=2770551 RepID=UPI00165E36A0|nr:DUF4395 domain-containing protein [Yimella sp. cx-51]MBC9957562.1 DUF4395 domain-containing protein [Yimella sp. cx-51]QTH37072.1 DUF4395 domain-containing protein [Yimella sp. cx-51]